MSLRNQLWPDWAPGQDPRTSFWDLWEPVREQFPGNVMGIDRFPAIVPDSDRYAALEVAYKADPRGEFDAAARRFVEVLDLLWAYGPTYAETRRPYADSLDELVPPLHTAVAELLARPADEPPPLEPMDDHARFRNLVILGLRGIVPSVFVFAAHKLVLWQNEVTFSQVYLGQLDYTPTLQTICTTCGLFLRR